MNDYKNESEDEHGWVNPAVSLTIWIFAAIGVASLIIYLLSL